MRAIGLRGFAGRVVHPRRPDPGVGQRHQLVAASAQGDTDVAQRFAMEAQAGRLVMIRAADIAQLVLRRFFEPFDAGSVEVR